jgi:SAM-dependent methyltransferase
MEHLMGVEWHTARFLVSCLQAGARFDQVATIGRQNLYVTPSEVGECFAEYGCRAADGLAGLAAEPVYAEPLFVALGARVVDSIDASGYERATIVRDMNEPIGNELVERFDVVFDGGSLEHVFNLPVALRNCLRMVRVGGCVIMQSPMNSFAGHGFYQFSPELLYRALSDENGFKVERMIAFEYYFRSQWYEVADPTVVGSRVELVPSSHRVGLLVRARRTRRAEIFQRVPQQSDYASSWSQSPAPPAKPQRPVYLDWKAKRGPRAAIRGSLERFAPGVLRFFRARKDAASNRRLSLKKQPLFFRPVDK